MEYGELFHEKKRPYFHEPQASEIQLESEITSIANLVPYKKRTAEKGKVSDISRPLTNQHAIPLFHHLQ